MQIKKNLICVMVAAATGAGLGAVLGYGPLLRYKADGVLKIGLDTAEYKRVADLARDPHNLSNYAAWSPPPDSNRAGVDHFVRALGQQSWMTPIPTVSKADEREVPDILLQREHDKLVNGGDRGRVYLGVELAYTAADPSEAANGARWLGAYFKDAATLEGLRQVVSEWAAESAEFSERATERRLKARACRDGNRVELGTSVLGKEGDERLGKPRLALKERGNFIRYLGRSCSQHIGRLKSAPEQRHEVLRMLALGYRGVYPAVLLMNIYLGKEGVSEY